MKATDSEGKEAEVSLTDPDPVLFVFKTTSEAQFPERHAAGRYLGSMRR